MSPETLLAVEIANFLRHNKSLRNEVVKQLDGLLVDPKEEVVITKEYILDLLLNHEVPLSEVLKHYTPNTRYP